MTYAAALDSLFCFDAASGLLGQLQQNKTAYTDEVSTNAENAKKSSGSKWSAS